MLPTYNTHHKAPLLAMAMLVLTLLQASSFNLTIAFRGPLANDGLISIVTFMWLAMYALCLVGLFASFGINWVTWLVRYRLLLTCLLAGTAFSAAWSVDPALSLERAVHLIGTTIVALYIGFSVPLNRILRISAIVLGFLMAASVFSAYFVPGLGLEDYQGELVWAGVLASKNTLGFWAAITLLLCVSLSFWTVPQALRALYLALATTAFICLYNSVSATSLLALITAGLVMLYLHTAFSLRLSMIAMLLLGLLVIGLLGVAFYFIDTAELIGRSGDLTGRGEVWSQTWKLILDRPFTGYGYGALWYPTDDTLWIQQSLTDFSWTVYHAHNGLLQVASEIGLPLTALALLMILQQLVEIIYCQYQRQRPGVLFVLGFVVALLVSNYSEARLMVNRDLYWIFFIALPVSMLQQVSIAANRHGYNTKSGPSMANDTHKLRTSRMRKEKKLNIKGRLKKLSALRVINPQVIDDSLVDDLEIDSKDISNNDSATTDEDFLAGTAARNNTSEPPSNPVIVGNNMRAASKVDVLRTKKYRRSNKAG